MVEEKPSLLEKSYEPWTRKPIYYWPLSVHGEFVGYVWASKSFHSAGFVAPIGRNRLWQDVWHARLDDGKRHELRPVDAVAKWIGAPEHPVGGQIPADSEAREAPDLATLYELTNPGGPPPPNPMIQDGAFVDGTPVDRSQGWGPLVSSPLPRYATTTQSVIRYFPITKDDTTIGYIWAATTGDAADYLPRAAVGRAGEIAAGLWNFRLSQDL
ncbi:hypothetical protein [Nocardia callitridis]|uniref:Uncharacterized protein n=1 Tax=Nocardia callitridis TaxID=648753 RepID=A0ABP9KG91_9NOCA